MTTDPPPTPALADAARRSSASFEMVLGPVLMALLGLLVDNWLGTRPVFILVFTLWGLVGAAASVYYRYRRQIAAVSAATAPRGGGPATERPRR